VHTPSIKLRSQDVLFAVRTKEHYIFARVIIGTTHIHDVAMQLSLYVVVQKNETLARIYTGGDQHIFSFGMQMKKEEEE
jgi:hypothetical protein